MELDSKTGLAGTFPHHDWVGNEEWAYRPGPACLQGLANQLEKSRFAGSRGRRMEFSFWRFVIFLGLYLIYNTGSGRYV